MKKRNRLLCLLIALALLVGTVPIKVFAAENTSVLTLGAENHFELNSPENAETFTFTAPEDGTYILYFKDISRWPIGRSISADSMMEYRHCWDCDFEGHKLEMKAGDTASVSFRYPGDYESLENYSGYSGTVGVSKQASEAEFTGFHALGAAENDPEFTFLLEDSSVLQFCTDNEFCCGVNWEISIDDESIITLDSDQSFEGPVSYDAAFNPLNVGTTTVTVKAAYGTTVKENTYTIQVVEGGGGGGNVSFSTIDELKTLLSDENCPSQLVYTGTGELVIPEGENIMIPAGNIFELQGKELRVASGASLTLGEGASLYCGKLTAEGALISSGFVNAGSSIVVSENGSLQCLEPGNVIVSYPAVIEGLDNIQFAYEGQTVEVHANVNADSLASILSQMSSNGIADERVSYHVFVPSYDGENTNTDQTLSQDITIPTHVNVNISDLNSFTVAEGVTISNSGMLGISSPFVLNGELSGQGDVWINKDEYSNGSITVGANGTYSGSGTLGINAMAGSSLEDIVKGLPLDDFDVQSQTNPDGSLFWNLKYAGGLIKLGTPTELSWGNRYADVWEHDETTGQDTITGYTKSSQPGIMSWKTVRPDQAQAQVKVYNESDVCVAETWCGFDPQQQPEYRSIEEFVLQDPESGTYYFTVQSMGDYETYRNSDIAKSGTYTYVKPEAKLSACTDPRWVDKDDEFVSWMQYTLPEDLDGLVGYQIEILYSSTENGEYETFAGMFTAFPDGENQTEFILGDEILQEKGVGYYKFRARLISTDIETVCNSDWTDLSPALDVQTIPANINNDLNSIISDVNDANDAGTTIPPQLIKDAVQSLDTTDLKTALLTDQDNTTTTAMLAEIENMAGGSADIYVTPDASAFKAADVSIVGANLNTNTSENPEEDPITLIIDKPEKEHVIPELYDSSVAVKFSMTLSNVEDPENLEVPVKISLPVPDNINPEFLVVFHYHANGETELLEPWVHEVDGKYYADFVLTSFSDFAMTQLHQHSYDKEVNEGIYLKTPADCVNPAVYYKSCACGEHGSETFVFGTAKGHSFDGADKSVCSVCGFKLYSVTSGSNQTYQKGGSNGLTFLSEADPAKFVSVKIDRKELDPQNYTIEPASGKITLKPVYLETLSDGKHVFSIVSSDGEAETSFTVAKKSTGNQAGNSGSTTKPSGSNQAEAPHTGDSSMLWMWYGLAASAVCAICGMTFLRKRMNAKNKR